MIKSLRRALVAVAGGLGVIIPAEYSVYHVRLCVGSVCE